MEISTAYVLAIGLVIALWLPYAISYYLAGKARGHTWFIWWMPRGHSLAVCGRVLTTEVMSPPGPANASYRLEMALDANAF